MPDQVLADAGLADVDAELQEFAVNVRRSPEWIFATEHTDQLANLLGETVLVPLESVFLVYPDLGR